MTWLMMQGDDFWQFCTRSIAFVFVGRAKVVHARLASTLGV